MPVGEDGCVYGMQLGECVENADPLRLGRVKVRIAGLIEPASDWAWPFGFAGQRYDVPKTKANYLTMSPPQDRPGDDCCVWFRDGDVDQPWYQPAHGGMPDGATPEVPTPVKTMAAADAPKVKSLEWEFFIITVDERPATKGITITDKTTGEVLFEYDGVAQGIRLKAVADLILESDGALHVIAALCDIMGRRVQVGADPI